MISLPRKLACAALMGTSLAYAPFPTPGHAADNSRPIGVILALEGNAYVARVGESRPKPVVVNEPIHDGDAIETQAKSRLQVLLERHIIVTLGPDSRLLTEETFSQPDEAGFLVTALTRGQARILVGEAGATERRSVDLRLPSSRLTLSGGYLAAWILEGPNSEYPEKPGQLPTIKSIGIANLGTTETLDVRVGADNTLRIGPGTFVLTGPGKQALGPFPHKGHEGVGRLLAATDLKPLPENVSPKAMLRRLEAGRYGRARDATPTVDGMTTGTALFTPPAVVSGVVPAVGTPTAHATAPAGTTSSTTVVAIPANSVPEPLPTPPPSPLPDASPKIKGRGK